LDEVEPLHQPAQHGLLHLRHGGLDRRRRLFAEDVIGPIAAGDADDRQVELATILHVVQRREQLALGEIAGGAEQHEGVGVGEATGVS
jgi:hypothetical protein